MNYIIGIDIGTSGTKAVAFSHDGDIVGNAYESYEPVVAPAGRHELSPEVLFRAFENSLSALMAMVARCASSSATASRRPAASAKW